MADIVDSGVSKVKIALGAASLFLFIIGVKRTFRKDDGLEVDASHLGSADGLPQDSASG